MTPEQIAVSTYNLAIWQVIVTGISLLLGPTVGILLSYWIQARKQKRDAKLALFLRLVSKRKIGTHSTESVEALNSIDVVFADSPLVTEAWRTYFSTLLQVPTPQNTQDSVRRWLDLLNAMAEVCGYSRLKQTTLDRAYWPQGLVNAEELQTELGGHWKRILERTEALLVKPKTDDPKRPI